MKNQSIISIRHLRKEYPNVVPLEDVSAEIKRGDFRDRPFRNREIHAAKVYQSFGNADIGGDYGRRCLYYG